MTKKTRAEIAKLLFDAITAAGLDSNPLICSDNSYEEEDGKRSGPPFASVLIDGDVDLLRVADAVIAATDEPSSPHLMPAAAFVSGARWARMAEAKAFDQKLLDEDARHYAETGGEIKCRGSGGLRHTMKPASDPS
jgi:hypothetical protein